MTDLKRIEELEKSILRLAYLCERLSRQVAELTGAVIDMQIVAARSVQFTSQNAHRAHLASMGSGVEQVSKDIEQTKNEIFAALNKSTEKIKNSLTEMSEAENVQR